MDDRRADEERPAEATHSLGECLSRVSNAGPSRGASSMGPPSTRTRSIVLAETDCVAGHVRLELGNVEFSDGKF